MRLRRTAMPVLSKLAVAILQRMEPGRPYEASGLRAFAPGLNLEALREVMRELWIAREVERSGDDVWRRARSTSTVLNAASNTPGLRIGAVRPEDLFDHDSFAGWFK
jgi:hypothetical protein